MNFGGIEACSLSDYEGEITTVLFTIGCPFRCKYCYNVDLLDQNNFKLSGRNIISEDEILEKLQKYKKMISAVTITGGEPCMNSDLPQFLQKLSWIGIDKIKIDTNGFNPELLQKCIDTKLVTKIAMDLKAPLDKYEAITSYKDIKNVEKSINILKNSTIPHEFRLTLYPELKIDDINRAIDLVPGETIYLQNFEPVHALTEDARTLKAIPKQIVEQIAEQKKSIANIKLRGFNG